MSQPPTCSSSSSLSASSSSTSLTSSTGIEGGEKSSGGSSPSPIEGIAGPSHEVLACILPKTETEELDNNVEEVVDDSSENESDEVINKIVKLMQQLIFKNN